MWCGSAASRRCLQALENHIAVELAATTVGMEALKFAHGDLAALVERTDAAHQVGDLLIVKVMAIAVGVAVVLPANEVVAGLKLRGVVALKRRGELGAGFGANGLARHALVIHKLPKADGDDAARARLAHQSVEHAYAVLARRHVVHKAKADRDVGERGVEKHVGCLGGVELHKGIEHVEFLEVQVGNAQGVTMCIDGQVLARVDAIELKRAAGICRGICTVDALGGKCAAGGKVLESHIAAGKIEDANGMLDRGDVELFERNVHGTHPAGPWGLARIGKGGGVLAIERIVELDERRGEIAVHGAELPPLAVRNKQYDHTTVNAATGTTEPWVIALFGHISAAHMCPQPPVVKNLTRIGGMLLAVADRFLTVQGALRTKTVRRHGWHHIGGTMNVETAQRLADLRRSKGFSQEGLARKLGLSRQAVSKWERAESSPDTENLISLAKLYGVSLDELLNPSDEIEDDIEFENEDRARQREAEAAERARTHEAAARATEAATQASDAAAKAAQAASWSAKAANAATAQATSGTAVGSTPVKGPFQSFPYWAVCWLLFFLLMFLFGAGPFAALIFFTIPIYHWVARALDGDWARGDIQVGPASVAIKAQGKDASAEPDADVATATTAEPCAKEGDE